MKSAIIFDRDETLIKDSGYMNDPSGINYIEGVFDTLHKLKDKYDFFIATNQSGVPRGLVDTKNLKLIHEKLTSDFKNEGIEIKDILWAPYMPESGHYYRKPNPGMLKEIINAHNYDPKLSWMVGDRESDILAANSAGVNSIFFNSSKKPENKTSTYSCSKFQEISKFILNH